LLYAFGEIVLVVLGILIALAINNYSEKVKSEARTIELLKKVRQELALNIETAASKIGFYSTKDSLITMILNGEVTREMYQTDSSTPLAIMNYARYVPETNAFDRLMVHGTEISTKFDSILNQLKNIYVTDMDLVIEFNERMAKEVDDFQGQLKLNTPWYWNLIKSLSLNEEGITMMLTDSFYKNHVANYWQLGLLNHYANIKNFRSNAYEAYLDISSLLDLEDQITESLFFSFDRDDCTGDYVSGLDTIRIKRVDNRLQFLLGNNPPEHILPYSRSAFCRERSRNFYRFDKFEGKVSALYIRFGQNERMFVKE